MSSRYTRPASPPDPRIVPAGTIPYAPSDAYYSRSVREPYQAPRSTAERVIPISTQTYVNGVPVSTTTRVPTYDNHNDRRVSEVPSQRRASVLGSTTSSTRARTTHVSNANDRPSSPVTRSAKYKYDADYYVTSASSSGPPKTQQKKVYSIDDERGSRLLNDSGSQTAAGRGSRSYHLSGQSSKSTRADDYGGYEYTDPRGMYSNTEPRTRTRRGSVEAPTDRYRGSIADDLVPARSGVREIGPPPTTRGLDKINGGVTRHGSLRDTPRSPQYYKDNGRGSYSEDDGLQARLMPTSQTPLVYERTVQGDSPPSDHDTRRRKSKYEDAMVASRGFGIRSGNTGGTGEAFLRESGSSNVPQLLDVGTIAVPYPRTSDMDLRGGYATEDAAYSENYSRSDTSRSDRSRRDHDARDLASERSRDYPRERDRDSARDPHADIRRPRDRDHDNDNRSRYREHRDRYDDDERRTRDKRSDRDEHRDRRDRDRDERKTRGDEESHLTPEVLTALAGGAAALGAGGLLASRERDRQRETAADRDDRDKRDRQREPRERDHDREDRDRVKVAAETDERDKRERTREIPPNEERERRDRVRDSQAQVQPQVLPPDERERRERPRDIQPLVHVQPPVQVPPPTQIQSPVQVQPQEDRERRDRPRDIQPQVNVPLPEDRERRERPRETLPVTTEEQEKRERPKEFSEHNNQNKLERRTSSPGDAPRERHYVTKDDRRERRDGEPPTPPTLDPDEEYRRRIELEKERSRQSKVEDSSREPTSANEARRRKTVEGTSRESQDSRIAREDEAHGSGETGTASIQPADSLALTRFGDAALVQEPSDITDNPRENRVRIVEPSSNKDKEKEREKEAPKGILRRPTNKFPEDPNPIREGVAPLKDATKKGVPPGARWTKIDRRLVNPEALEEAKERFEERQDCVIVLRVLTKEEIQKFAERTAEIRDRYDRDRRRRKDKEREHDGADEDSADSEDGPRKITWEK